MNPSPTPFAALFLTPPRRSCRLSLSILILCSSVLSAAVFSAEPDAEPGESNQAKASEVTAGHSYHGEAFNEGPRQAAVLIDELAPLEFPVTTKSESAKQFFLQGLSQLHGFWYLEAERSFRQAADDDPKLAIAYWGMAMANANNAKRARGLIDEAKQLAKHAGEHEKMYIDALHRFLPSTKELEAKKDQPKKLSADEKKKENDAKTSRALRYADDLDKILHKFPDDIEAKALIALHLWQSERVGLKIASRYAVDALLSEVFEANPMHPAHHFRIHLWDSRRPENALQSAAQCGPSSPAIAHMWHMPGHIYSRLKRYHDAAWQQEASARVDHAHMARARLMPDQIHNFAHNNEWLIRNLLYLGRVDDALDQARNLVSLPMHPKYNSPSKRGSYQYGRQRLLQTLLQYNLWDELIAETGGPYLAPSDDEEQQQEWLAHLAIARFMSGDTKRASKTMRSLQRRRIALETQLLDLADELARDQKRKGESKEKGEDKKENDENESDELAKKPTREELKKKLDSLRQSIAKVAAVSAAIRKDKSRLETHLKKAKFDLTFQAQLTAKSGDLPGAIKLAERAVREGENQVRPLAVLVDVLWKKGDKSRAKKEFEKLQRVAGHADLKTPMLAELAPVAKAFEKKADWRLPAEPADDIGERPPLDQLGPFRWQPYQAPSWTAQTAAGEKISSEEHEGRARLVIFYLGFGCLHCIEQLHAFSPKIDEFAQAGIEVIAISTENPDELATGIDNFDKALPIPLIADGNKDVFKAYGCWDDFEDQPLHGTFLIDAQDRVRWQDISFEPFLDVDFALQESKRLLKLNPSRTD